MFQTVKNETEYALMRIQRIQIVRVPEKRPKLCYISILHAPEDMA